MTNTSIFQRKAGDCTGKENNQNNILMRVTVTLIEVVGVQRFVW